MSAASFCSIMSSAQTLPLNEKEISDYSLISAKNTSQTAAIVRQKLAAMKPQDFMEMYKRTKMRRPSRSAAGFLPENKSKAAGEKTLAASALPENFRVAAEFEELQAVYIAWPYNAFDSTGEFVEPFIKGQALTYEEIAPDQYRAKLISVDIFEPDLDDQSPYAHTWATLASVIQQEVPVWIQIHRPQDSTAIKQFMSKYGMPLTNYRFMLKDDWGNAFWMRDCGPYGFYYSANDSLAFLNASYYPGRPLDDDIPEFIANKLGYKSFYTGLEIEGGNFMTDGHGTGFYSDVLFENNNDNLGRAYTSKTPVSPARLRDTIKRVFGLATPIELKQLQCDGGTGHIDIYTKIMNDHTIAVTEYPEVMRTAAFNDYGIVQNNFTNKISTAQTIDGKPFDIVRVPLPTSDNGTYDSITCEQFNWDARGFINGLFVNNTFIFPSFSDDISGNAELDNKAKAIYEKILPGYNVVPIDARWLTPLGGAIHCITMQIPSENPVNFRHIPLSGVIRKPMQGGFDLTATITNHSGMATSVCKWRKVGETTWHDLPSTQDAANLVATIPAGTLVDGDEIEYYFSATTKNGRTVVYPTKAPARYFHFVIGEPSGVDDEFNGGDAALSISPNPFSGAADCRFVLPAPATTEVRVTNLLGQTLLTLQGGALEAGVHSLPMNMSAFPQGMYFVTLVANGSVLHTARAIVR